MIRIVTDSSAYITRQEAELLGVTVVPMTYSVEGGMMYTESYIDECGAYERQIAQNAARMRTSQATLGSFLSTFEDLLQAGDEVLCVTMSSRLSGTYANARMAAREFDAARIEVVDSLTTGAGLFLLIQKARQMIRQGLNLKGTADRIKVLRESVRTYFSVDDMTSLWRSGRLGSVRMSVSTILNIKPLLVCKEGGIVSIGIARGRLEQMRALMRPLAQCKTPIVVQSFMGDAQAEKLIAALKDEAYDITLRKVGPVLGIHLGRGSVGIAWMDQSAE